jgi:hypothetical protein
MAGSSSVESSCDCGRLWLLTRRKRTLRDKDELYCVCGRTIASWDGVSVWTAKLLKGPDKAAPPKSGASASGH